MFAAPLSWMNPGSLRPLIVSTTSKHYRQLSFKNSMMFPFFFFQLMLLITKYFWDSPKTVFKKFKLGSDFRNLTLPKMV